MEQLNKTPTSGNFGNVAKVIDTNFGLVVTKLLELEQGSKDMNVGFYSSESELKVAYPNPEKGMIRGQRNGLHRVSLQDGWYMDEDHGDL